MISKFELVSLSLFFVNCIGCRMQRVHASIGVLIFSMISICRPNLICVGSLDRSKVGRVLPNMSRGLGLLS